MGNVLLANGYGLHNLNYIASQLANYVSCIIKNFTQIWSEAILGRSKLCKAMCLVQYALHFFIYSGRPLDLASIGISLNTFHFYIFVYLLKSNPLSTP